MRIFTEHSLCAGHQVGTEDKDKIPALMQLTFCWVETDYQSLNKTTACQVVTSAIKQNKAKERGRGANLARRLRTASLRMQYQSRDLHHVSMLLCRVRASQAKGTDPSMFLSWQPARKAPGTKRRPKRPGLGGQGGSRIHRGLFMLFSER